jgi:glutathione S-transferase
MKLYQHPFSSASFKVRALITELGINCELVNVEMMKGEHKSPAFLAKNPNGKIPVLEDNGFLVWESNAILCYLAALKPERGLMPTDVKGMAQLHQWLQWQATSLAVSTTEVMMQTVYARFFGRERDDEKYDEGIKHVRRDLRVLEASLAGREFICGKLTIADFSIVSALQLRGPMDLELEDFPNVTTWVERMESRESVRTSLPPL